MKWTVDQERAITTTDKNLLVSAAAGSGKTAVLVERILRRLLRKESPANITDFLVVTFTKAAASELREKLEKRILKTLEEEALDERAASHLRKQLVLLPKADVSTIDSFCQRVVRDSIHLTDIDPAFRIGDEGELSLLGRDALDALLESEYEAGSEPFQLLTEYFSSEKTENRLDEAILSLYGYAKNAEDPEAWLDECLSPYLIDTAEAFRSAPWNVRFLQSADQKIARIGECLKEADEAIHCGAGHLPYNERLQEFREAYKLFHPGDGYKEYHDHLFAISELLERDLGSLSRRKSDADPEMKNRAKEALTCARDTFKSLQELFREDEEGILLEFREMRPVVSALVSLVRKYDEVLREAKKKKQIADFNDVAHAALSILKRGGEPTDTAKAISKRYEEILIDEYQDSSGIQEALLNAVAKKRNNVPVNLFMVGDMKQSIYRFRMADPGLFVGKYDSFPDAAEQGDTGKVELRENFRSRKEVTEGVNYFFRRFMVKEVGDVAYTEDAFLRAGRSFLETDRRSGGPVEILGATSKLPQPEADNREETADRPDLESGTQGEADPGNGADDADDAETLAKAEIEAHMIAQEIERIVSPDDPLYVEAEEDGEKIMRPAAYRDIVILLRSTSDAEKVYPKVFEQYRIPCYIERKHGFYDTFEVRFVLSVLSVVDNPIDDVALGAMLHSPMYGVTSEELAAIAAKTRGKNELLPLYDMIKRYLETENDALSEKLRRALSDVSVFRLAANEEPLSLLIRFIAKKTGLETFVTAMAGGKQRSANLSMLSDEAVRFEKTVYRGVFNFLRYVEKKREVTEEGEVNVAGKNDNIVRILTIHASKGLQYPVVFAAGLGKRFNTQDERGTFLLHQKMGIGMNVRRPAIRTVRESYYRKAVKQAIHVDNVGEEIRDLYVAMTRAEEKLYLTASHSDMEKQYENRMERWKTGDGFLTADEVSSSQSFLSLILDCLSESAPVEVRGIFDQTCVRKSGSEEEAGKQKTSLLRELARPASEETVKKVETLLGFRYRYDDCRDIRSTLSVSLLKRLETVDPLKEADLPALVDDKHYEGAPEIESKTDREKAKSMIFRKSGITGAERGTLYHRVMELIDPTLPATEAIDALRNNCLLSDTENDTIQSELVDRFLRSGLGQRFVSAYREGKAHRETPFIISLPVHEIDLYRGAALRDEETRVMLQGVIDLYFEEEDGLVLVDYKTDRVSDPRELSETYQSQIRYYEKALAMMTGKPVKEKWIYSFALGKEIAV